MPDWMIVLSASNHSMERNEGRLVANWEQCKLEEINLKTRKKFI
jgi:hypothetical protein